MNNKERGERRMEVNGLEVKLVFAKTSNAEIPAKVAELLRQIYARTVNA
jgi:hypothetical protein